MKNKKIIEVHVLPWDDGTKYKNGKPKLKWKVKLQEANRATKE